MRELCSIILYLLAAQAKVDDADTPFTLWFKERVAASQKDLGTFKINQAYQTINGAIREQNAPAELWEKLEVRK